MRLVWTRTSHTFQRNLVGRDTRIRKKLKKIWSVCFRNECGEVLTPHVCVLERRTSVEKRKMYYLMQFVLWYETSITKDRPLVSAQGVRTLSRSPKRFSVAPHARSLPHSCFRDNVATDASRSRCRILHSFHQTFSHRRFACARPIGGCDT